MKRRFLAGCPYFVILGVTVAVYWRVLEAGFLVNWDDPLYVTRNPAIRGLSWLHLKEVFSSFYVGNYAPLQMVSYMFDYELWGLNPAGFHLSNLLLHVASACLLMVLLRRLGCSATGAILGALVFAVHPVQVESVAWISQRKNVLAMFFFLVAFLLYLRYLDRRSSLSLWGSVSCFVVALLAKSVVVVFPVVLVLYDLCFHPSRGWRQKIAEKSPYILVAAVGAVLAIVSQDATYLGGKAEAYYGGSPWATFLTMLPVLVTYAGMLLWPTRLSAIYDPPIKQNIDGEVLGAVLFLTLYAVAMFLLWRKNRPLFFWGGVLFLGILPVSQIVPLVTLMNDRYLYFPLLGLAGGVAVVSSLVQQRSMLWARLYVVTILLLVVGGALLSWQRVGVWNNSVSLWGDATQKVPNNDGAWYMLGEGHHFAGELQQAELAYGKVLELFPYHPKALKMIAQVKFDQGDYAVAIRHFKNYSAYFPTDPTGYLGQGNSNYRLRNYAQAAAAYRHAVELDRTNPEARLYLGNSLLHQGDLEGAAFQYLEARKARAWQAEADYGLACVAALQDRSAESLEYLAKAISGGFTDIKRIQNNRELDKIRQLPGFSNLIR